MRTPKENPAAREKLLEMAQLLMLAKGYTATSVEEICEASHLTKGSFFHYFASKEDLGKAVLDRYVNTMFQAAQNAPFSKKADPLQRLYGYIDFMAEVSKDPARRSGCLLGNFAQVLTDTHPEIRKQCAAHFSLWADMLKQQLDAAKTAYKVKGLDTGTLADHFIALFEGSLMLAKTRQDLDIIANIFFISKSIWKVYLKRNENRSLSRITMIVKPKSIYRALLLVCGFYFIAVAIAHQMGTKLPMLFIFYNIPSERYQDLIISFLSFGWAMLFGIGFFDEELIKIHVPILLSGIVAIYGLIRARLEIQFYQEIDFEIAALSVLLFALLASYIAASMKKGMTHIRK